MKKFLIISSIIFFLIFLVAFIVATPFLAYWAILNNKFTFEFFRIDPAEKLEKFLSPGEVIRGSDIDAQDAFEDKYWKSFHVANYRLPMPLFHPQILVSPIIHEEDYKEFLQLGVRFHTQNQKVIGEIFLNEGRKFHKHIDSQGLFTIPIVKTYLERWPIEDIWKDLFQKDLNQRSFWNILKIPPQDLIYNLYILHLRAKFFPEETVSYFYQEKLKMGGVEVDWKNSELRKEMNLFLIDGVLESYTLITNKEARISSSIRKRIRENVYFSPSFIDETKVIYEEFRDLPYQSKIGVEGMIYLYSAWSHNTHDKEFLREIIGHLERGEGNLTQLQPLYVYAFKHYGEEFNTNRKKIKDLEAKIKEEDQKEILDEQNKRTNTPDLEFADREERMRYFLQKAKDNSKGQDSKDTLIFD